MYMCIFLSLFGTLEPSLFTIKGFWFLFLFFPLFGGEGEIQIVYRLHQHSVESTTVMKLTFEKIP